VFSPERLQAQQQQVLRRLEQLDQPARVIAFPAATRAELNGSTGRRVAVSWVGVAAAAGLVIGVVSGQVSARLTHPTPAPVVTTAAAPSPDAALAAEATPGPVDSSILDNPYENTDLPSMVALNYMTPRVTQLVGKK